MYKDYTIRSVDKVEASPLGLNIPINQGFYPQESGKVERFESTLTTEYWEYRQKWVDYPKHNIVGDFPINVDFEVTNACNLKCTMCPRTNMIKKGTFYEIGQISLETYKRIVDEGVPLGLCAVKHNFMGEPLMHPQLVDMIRYSKQAGVLDVMFNTNATLLTEEKSRELIESGLDKIFFSFDSPYKEKYEAIRIGADYDEVLNNIKRFGEIRDEMGSIKPLTRVSMVVTKESIEDKDAFKKLFEPIVDVIAFIDFMSHVGMNREKDMLVEKKASETKYCCPQPWQRMIIHPDGLVSPCCGNSNRSLKMGNIFEQSAHEIWVGEAFQRLRELHASGRFEEIPTCAACPLSKYESELKCPK